MRSNQISKKSSQISQPRSLGQSSHQSSRFNSNTHIDYSQSKTMNKSINSPLKKKKGKVVFRNEIEDLQQKEMTLKNEISILRNLQNDLQGNNDFLKDKLQEISKINEKLGKQPSKQAIHILALEQENKFLLQQIADQKRKLIQQQELIQQIESGQMDQQILHLTQQISQNKQYHKYLQYKDPDTHMNAQELEASYNNNLRGIKAKLAKLEQENAVLEKNEREHEELQEKLRQEKEERLAQQKIHGENVQKELQSQNFQQQQQPQAFPKLESQIQEENSNLQESEVSRDNQTFKSSKINLDRSSHIIQKNDSQTNSIVSTPVSGAYTNKTSPQIVVRNQRVF